LPTGPPAVYSNGGWSASDVAAIAASVGTAPREPGDSTPRRGDLHPPGRSYPRGTEPPGAAAGTRAADQPVWSDRGPQPADRTLRPAEHAEQFHECLAHLLRHAVATVSRTRDDAARRVRQVDRVRAVGAGVLPLVPGARGAAGVDCHAAVGP